MCGRFTLTAEAAGLQQQFKLDEIPADWVPRYNIAPTQPVAVVTSADERKISWMHWGLIPYWAKSMDIGNRMINARCETLQEKPSFKQAFSHRRCLVFADGFYEWQKSRDTHCVIPYYFHRVGKCPFAFAGLWEQWKSPQGALVYSTTIVTCQANTLVASVHDRMPVMLNESNSWDWIKNNDSNVLVKMMVPYPENDMTSFSVTKLVNNPNNDFPECILPMDE